VGLRVGNQSEGKAEGLSGWCAGGAGADGGVKSGGSTRWASGRERGGWRWATIGVRGASS